MKKCQNPPCESSVEGKTKNGSIRLYCSKKCSSTHNSIKSREKFKNTCKEKYGGCGAASAEIKEKMEQTNIEKYGVPSFLSTEEKKIKTKVTNLEKYGAEHHLQTEEILNKQKFTVKQKYGTENISQIQKIKDKKIETTKKNYGVSHHFQNESLLESRKKTCIQKYGAEYPINGYNFKDYQLPSGKIIRIQGFENKALDELLKIYTEDEIVVGKSVPRIKYTGLDDKIHTYYPDIYIPKENLIIEVKSKWTIRQNLETNLLKEDATRKAGYNFEYKIF